MSEQLYDGQFKSASVHWARSLGVGDPVAGCLRKATSGLVPQAVAPKPASAKFESPEACFQKFAELGAQDNVDQSAMLQCMSEAYANFLAGNLAFQLQRHTFSEDDKASAACLKVLKSHGLDQVDMMEFLQIVDSPVPGGATPGFMQIGDSIKDKAAFFRDSKAAMLAVDDAAKPAGENRAKTTAAEPEEKPPIPKLVDVQIHGDHAEGIAIRGDDEFSKMQIFFRRINGSWVLAYGAKEPDWKEPIQGRFRFSDLLNNKP